jgi:alkylation response protein AidB-like acyl-CoA dehydrogenase
VTQLFFNENRIRQAASSLGAAEYCLDQAIEYAKNRKPFGKALATNQGIQFPIVELVTQCEMLRALIHKTAWEMDTYGTFSASDKVSMCNYVANRLCCQAADQAMQVHGGLGYSRHMPFEHIYRHHRRYRITEGAEEIQMRRVAGYLFGFMSQQAPKGVASVHG